MSISGLPSGTVIVVVNSDGGVVLGSYTVIWKKLLLLRVENRYHVFGNSTDASRMETTCFTSLGIVYWKLHADVL